MIHPLTNLLFYSEIPLIDHLVVDMIPEIVTEIVIIRSIPQLVEMFNKGHQFGVALLYVDGPNHDITFLINLITVRNLPIHIIVCGPYEGQKKLLEEAGVKSFLPKLPQKSDFDSLFNLLTKV